MDKIHNCLNLLIEAGYIEEKESLKETYESVIGIYNIERNNPEMWKMVWNHDIQSLFQMEKQSGISGIATLKPTSVDDLAILNSTIRLMAQEKGGEMPTDKLARFKAHPEDWDKEILKYGLTSKEKEILEPVLGMSYGLCIAQEQFMELVQLPELGGFSLTWADKLRKSIAKKNPKDYDALTKEFFEVTEEKGIDRSFAHYVWDVLIAMSKGYGFNQSHTLAYSLIALQEMNLAYNYPIIFWNCACLISDAGGSDEENIDEIEIVEEEVYNDSIEEFTIEDEDDDSEDSEDDDTIEVKKKKKSSTANYGKIATAIGKMRMAGIEVESPDINKSSFTFSPDADKNVIRYGLSGITRIGEELVKDIISKRPYNSIEDFLSKIKVNKPQMINLIKCGAFDGIYDDRVEAMKIFVRIAADCKKRLNLQNAKMLIDFGLIPDELSFNKKVFNYNAYLKKFKTNTHFILDNIALNFYSANFDMDLLEPCSEAESGFKINKATWKVIYDKYMNAIRDYIKKNHDELLEKVNNRLIDEVWNKYCLGTLSKWEMDSVACYFHEHELTNVNDEDFGIVDYYNQPDQPVIDRYIPIKGQRVPIFRVIRIMGTVLDKDKAKKTITLLTKSGIVTVKIYGTVYANFDKQISERGADGVKHVKEKSWFSRGNKVIVTGLKREDSFIAKKYTSTPFSLLELITDIDEYGNITTQSERTAAI